MTGCPRARDTVTWRSSRRKRDTLRSRFVFFFYGGDQDRQRGVIWDTMKPLGKWKWLFFCTLRVSFGESSWTGLAQWRKWRVICINFQFESHHPKSGHRPRGLIFPNTLSRTRAGPTFRRGGKLMMLFGHESPVRHGSIDLNHNLNRPCERQVP